MAEENEEPLWRPSAALAATSAMSRFMRRAGERHGREFASYDELWRWSTDELEDFWAEIWDQGGVVASRPYERVLATREMPGARWFQGAELNYAENLLARGGADELAVIHTSELRADGELTRGELRALVAAAGAGLRELGVERGDRVVAYMPNIAETLVAFLACASIGAIWSSAAPEFGARSVIDRFAQIEPKVLLAVDGYRHAGKDHDRRAVIEELRRELPTVEHVVVLDYLSPGAEPPAGANSWQALLAAGAGAGAHFEQVAFDHPLWVLYSSGTTGLPKAIVHGHGGILVEQLKKALHLDLRPADRMFWFTTTGWMMWNFLVGCLLGDGAIVLYDGSPAYPDLGALWDLAERTSITCLGASAGLIAACEKEGVVPRERDLSALRAVGSTGSPLAPESFHWVYDNVGEDIWLYSTSGGTDVCTAFVGGCPLLPVYVGELQCRALGCAVQAWDEDGHALEDEVGELVITEPMPSMPLFMWGDEDGSRLRESYFDMFPGVWRHGDWIRVTPRGGAVIYGRSDSTINRQGVRMGTSEIYRAAATVPAVLDALVVDIPKDGDASELWMILFVVLADGAALDDALREQIRAAIRAHCSPRHVPNEILQVEQVPRTLSGKLLEVPVKRILMGMEPGRAASAGSLADPAALDYFVALARARASGPRSPS
ncbi:MAG TPA: acetoacetate--CoA ligase [Solirubrobacteraceae bacterium]|nr:acetoacetate--CoA ligase [Solirubrobacteraceae bacterium]